MLNSIGGKENKEINDLAQAAKRFIFLKATGCTSEVASLCPQASSASLCNWTWTRCSSSAAYCFSSGFVCGISAHEEVTDDGAWALLALWDMGISVYSSPSLLFPRSSWPFPWVFGRSRAGWWVSVP